jgi:hypothetical protein
MLETFFKSHVKFCSAMPKGLRLLVWELEGLETQVFSKHVQNRKMDEKIFKVEKRFCTADELKSLTLSKIWKKVFFRVAFFSKTCLKSENARNIFQRSCQVLFCDDQRAPTPCVGNLRGSKLKFFQNTFKNGNWMKNFSKLRKSFAPSTNSKV